MASAALTSLIGTLYFTMERVPPHLRETTLALAATLDSMFLKNMRIGDGVEAAVIKDFETKIRDFALQVEDDFEIQLSNFLLAQDTESQQKASMLLSHILIRAKSDVLEFSSFIDRNIYRSFMASEFQHHHPSPPLLKHASSSSSSSSKTKRVFDEEYKMVGREHDYGVIKHRLLDENFKSLKLTSIVGMAGIGKTTLAESLYRDPQVASRFKVRGWVTMPRECEERQLLWDLLGSITLALGEPNEVEKGSWSLKKLAKQVCKCLLDKRYLIVLDNFWKELDYIEECFPNDANGSCILLTSKHIQLGFISKNPFAYVHKMTLLGPNESWDLFCNILSLNGCVVSKFEKIRVDVVEKCDGLPQSLVVVAERLSKCNIILKEWKKVEKELELLGPLDRRELTHHYNQLPHHLKVCFLYLAVFPRRSKIQVKVLIRLWIAEGMVKPWWPSWAEEVLEDVAYSYLEQLILNSLLLLDNQSLDGKIKTCRMHSALHSFCVREAQKEGIFCALNIKKYPIGLPLKVFANSCRWLSLYSHKFDYYVLFRENNSRSIFFFHENPEMFISFKLLRVLAFVPSSFLQRAPMRLSDLVFLRYLSVTQWFEGLDCILSTNRNLQTLVVSGNESQLGAPIIHLPCEIWDLPLLRHLELDNMYALDLPFHMEDRTNLQTLSWASPTLFKKEAYCNFPNLTKLKVFYGAETSSNNNPLMLDNIDYLEKLEKLTISVLVGCTITLLSEQCMFPSRLKKLGLSGTNLCSRDLSVISMLPQLEVLKLENAIHGNIWEVDKRGFNQLRLLLIEDRKLEQLRTYLSCFKCLERLVLRLCCCLEEIPWFLAFHVQSIELDRCHSSVIEAAMQIREAGHKILKRRIEIIIQPGT